MSSLQYRIASHSAILEHWESLWVCVCVCVCVCSVAWLLYVSSSVSVTYCDDIQNAEEAMDTVSCIDLLHQTFFAILEDISIKLFKNNHSCNTNTEIKPKLTSQSNFIHLKTKDPRLWVRHIRLIKRFKIFKTKYPW